MKILDFFSKLSSFDMLVYIWMCSWQEHVKMCQGSNTCWKDLGISYSFSEDLENCYSQGFPLNDSLLDITLWDLLINTWALMLYALLLTLFWWHCLIAQPCKSPIGCSVLCYVHYTSRVIMNRVVQMDVAPNIAPNQVHCSWRHRSIIFHVLHQHHFAWVL